MIYRKILLFISSCLFSFLCTAQKKEVQVVLLAGQSNMAGHGNFDALDEKALDRVKKAGIRVKLATREPQKKEPVPLTWYNGGSNKKYNFKKHFGPELFSGVVLSETYPEDDFLLIKTAVGGTSLYGAWNPNWTQEKAKIAERGAARQSMQLYQKHIKNIKSNLAVLESKGIPYKIVGVLWMQGEADTNNELKATAYQQNLENLIAAYRKEFGIEKLPFVIGQINIPPRKFKQGPTLVRKAMEQVVADNKNVALVKTSTDVSWTDYPKHSDDTHYNTEGQKRLGVAFAKALCSILK
ncbi:sialate O-acetylesterase [Ochrovirga pacifica]|uniref:sialate O-acetylesterase n=1 Tax=Ochrovirga pacifica TaxID=1042376 RepID=UPI0008FBC49A|nr:sialate O-acetylesterase [Ochrovirga pacifica]